MNLHQLLEEEDLEEKVEELFLMLDKTPRTTNTALSSNNQRSNSDEYDADYITIERLNNAVQEILCNDRWELSTINQKCWEISATLLLKDHEKLECYN